MVNRTPQTQTLPALLEALAAAVRAGDRYGAMQLERAILQRLAAAAADREAIERQVRDLMASLEEPTTALPDEILDPFNVERGGQYTYSGSDRADDYSRASGSPHPSTDGLVYPVWFGTNRKPAAAGQGFTGERHSHTTLGRVDVYVPEAHRFGEIGNDFWTKLRRFDLRDDRLRIQHLATQTSSEFYADLHQAMQTAQDQGETHALIFLHGFNVSFEEAAIRAAQLGFDLKVPGTTAFFSWPSRGTVTAYPADEASIEASEQAITDFLVDFTARCGAEKVHIIAHSMGNRGLLRALQRIEGNAQTCGQVKFDQIFLAAPDVDRDLFLDLARLYPPHAQRTTLYASDADLPVHLSARLHDAPRAGYFTPYTVAAGLDTVAVPDFDIDLLGHSYFAEAEALLHDLYDLMRHNQAPGQRQRIKSALDGIQQFWRLVR
jgi:esterase/lipase superfamily enzyme